MQSEMDALRDAVSRLGQAGVEYMLTGSLAMAFYEKPRFTNDIDLVVALDAGQAARFVDAFEQGYYRPKDPNPEGSLRDGVISFLHEASNTNLNFILLNDDPCERMKFSRRTLFALPGFTIQVSCREDSLLAGQGELWQNPKTMAGSRADVARESYARVMRLAPVERLKMASGMFDMAREIAMATLQADLPESVRNYHISVHIYGAEFEPLARRVYLDRPRQ